MSTSTRIVMISEREAILEESLRAMIDRVLRLDPSAKNYDDVKLAQRALTVAGREELAIRR